MKHYETVSAVLVAVALFAAAPAHAQFNGSHTLGDFGVQSASQPAPGLYVAGFFYDPSEDAPKIDLGGVETIKTDLLRIKVDAKEIPVELDGRPIGLAPLTTQVAPGSHIVKLYAGSQPTGFMINVAGDPSEWCFEARGRSFKNVRCQ